MRFLDGLFPRRRRPGIEGAAIVAGEVAGGKKKTPVERRVFSSVFLARCFHLMPAQSIHRFLATQMRVLRRRHDLTQEQMAALIGCDYKYYQAIEAGSKDLKLSMVERLAKPFRIPAEHLLWEVIPPTTIEEPPASKKRKRS